MSMNMFNGTLCESFERFQQSLLEKEIPLSDILSEYTVDDMGNGKFTVEIEGVPKQFSVLPLPQDLKACKDVFFKLTNAITNRLPYEMYKTLKIIEVIHYDFGNIFSTSLSLSNVKELSTNLTDEQRNMLQASDEDFLKNEFSNLSKETRDAILKYLMKLSQLYAVVLESLFYYTRTGSDKDFYEGMDFNTILKEYQTVIDIIAKNKELKIEGPFADIKNKLKLESKVDYAYWALDKYVIRASLSPTILNSEENITGKKGLNFTFLDSNLKELAESYTTFFYKNLEKKIDELKLNESVLESDTPRVKKGDKITVNFSFLEGKPDSVIEASTDSFFHEKDNCEYVSFLFGGDMMQIARFKNDKWIS